MSLKKTILKNFASLMTSTVIARLLTLVIVIIIARYLGKEQFGIYAAAQAFVGMFVIVFGFGAEFGFVYEGSKNKDVIGWFLGSGIILKLLLGFISFFIILFIAHLLGYTDLHVGVITIFVFIWFFITFQNFLSGVFQIHQRMEFKAIVDMGRELLFLITLLVVIRLGYNIYFVAGAKLVSNILLLILAIVLVFKFTKPVFKDLKLGHVIKSSYLFALSGVFYMIYFQIDTVMLSLMRTPGETGIYAAAYKLPVSAFLISRIIATVTRPAMFERESRDRDTLKKMYFLRTKYLVILGLLGGISLWFLRNQIISFIYGTEFAEAAIVLSILAWFIPIRFISIVSGDIITTMAKQNIRTIIQGITAAINIVLNVILIPRYGLYGAAWSTLCSELFLLIAYTLLAAKLFVPLPLMSTFFKPLLAAVIMSAIILSFNTYWVISFALGVIVYFALLYAFGVFKNDPLINMAAKRISQ